jgi:hypothetical protein
MSRRDPQGLRRTSDDSQPEYPHQPAAAAYPGPDEPPISREQREVVRVFPYGVARNRLIQAAKRLGVPILVENDIGQAQVVVTLRTHFRKRPKPIVDAEHHGTPIYVLRSNTISQMEAFLSGLFNLSPSGPRPQNEDEAMHQTQSAIDAVLNGERWVELAPASSYVRRLQHQMARQANLHSYSFGKEPNRRVRIYRE